MAEESMRLQVLKCPSCGKPITRLSSLKSTMSCPRCGNIIKNPMATAKAFVRPERIIPFTTDEQTPPAPKKLTRSHMLTAHT